jgi:hypothetical protein
MIPRRIVVQDHTVAERTVQKNSTTNPQDEKELT